MDYCKMIWEAVGVLIMFVGPVGLSFFAGRAYQKSKMRLEELKGR